MILPRSEQYQLTKIQVLRSVTTSLRPFITDSLALGSDTRSKLRRSFANSRCSLVNQILPAPLSELGKSGMKKGPMKAKKTPVQASMMKSHCQPARPIVPSRPEKTPAAMRPELPMAIHRAAYSEVIRRASSARVYQDDKT